MQVIRELPTEQTSPETTYDSIEPSKPDVVYADVVQIPEPVTPALGPNDHLYENFQSNNNYTKNGGVVYSDLQSRT